MILLLIVIASGCGDTTSSVREHGSHKGEFPTDHMEADVLDHMKADVSKHPNGVVVEAHDGVVVEDEITGTEIENRKDFTGTWGEIDTNEQIRFSESGTVSISGGEMAFRGRYRVTEKGIAKLSLDGLGEFFGTVTGTLSASGDELEIIAEVAPDEPSSYRRKESPPTSGKPGDLRNSPQAMAAIDTAIRKSLDKETGEITEADLAMVTNLDLANKDIVDLAALAGMTELESLNLNGNWIIDLKPLAGLTKLKVLGLTDNRVSDPSPLAGLTELRDLRLNGNRISDLKALATLTQLVLLQLDGNQITDLAPLESLKKTRFIELQDNPDLTRAEIDRLQAVLSQGKVNHNATQ